MANKMTTAGASFGMPAKFGNERVMQISPKQGGYKDAALSKNATNKNTLMNKKPIASKGKMK